ncbi:hypothetical protein ABK040_009078 [Willaertia magna]
MKTTHLLFHATMFWLGFLVLSLTNKFFRDYVYSSLIGEIFSHQISSLLILFLNGLIMFAFFKQQSLFFLKDEAQEKQKEEINKKSLQIVFGITKSQLIMIGLWWLFLTLIFELTFGLFFFGHYVWIKKWTLDHAVILVIIAQITLPIAISYFVLNNLDKKRTH